MQRLDVGERPRPPRPRSSVPIKPETPNSSAIHVEEVALSTKAIKDLFHDAEQRLCNGSSPLHVVEEVTTKCTHLFMEERHQPAQAIQLLQNYCTFIAASKVPVTRSPKGRTFLSAIARSLDNKTEAISGHDMAILFQCYGILGANVLKMKGMEMEMPAIISRMCIKAELLLDEMSPNDITGVMWALGSLEFSHCDDLLHAIVYQTGPSVKRGEFRPKCVASLIWTLGKLGFKDGSMLLRALVREAKRHLREFSANELTQILLGISRVKFRSATGLLKGLTSEVNARIEEFDTKDLISMTLCFSRLSFRVGDNFLDCVSKRVFDPHSNTTPLDVSKFLYACALQGYYTEFLSQSVKSHFTSFIQEYPVFNISNLIWSLAIVGDLDMETFALGVNKLDKPERNIDEGALAKIYQCILHLRIIEKKSITEEIVSPEFEEVCRQAWVQEQHHNSVEGTENVVSTLEDMGYSCERSNQLKDGAFDVCTVSSGAGEIGVIVVSYPLQFYLNDRKRLLATQDWFLKVYKSVGLKVLWLKEEEWNQVPLEARQNHLGKKIQQVFAS